MESILEAINEWIKEILIGAINGNLSTMFGDVNEKVGTIAAEVGKTPQGWNANIFSMIQNLSENVIVPIAGLVITYVLCYELISMVTEKNNMHDIETFMFFKWFFKAFVAVFLVTHTFDITMAVFDMAQHIVSGAAGVIGGDTNIDVTEALAAMQEGLKDMEIPELLLLVMETSLVSLCMKIMSVLITVILYGRMIEIYAYCSVSPIPFATMTNREWGQIGNNYLKGLFALGFQAVNAYYRKHKTLDGCPHLPPEELEKLKADMASSWHLEDKPFATWALSNNSAEIRRVKDRIKSLSQQKEIGFVGWKFDGGKVEANTEANRLQIFFEDKPDEATREALKSNGFRWSPKAGAWQRQLTSNAYYAADYVKAIVPLTGEKPTELQRAHIRAQKVDAQEQPEQEAPQDKDTFSIYQIKGGDETRDLRFEPYDRLTATGHRVDAKNYTLVYSAELTPGTSLEDIYTRFNIDHPKDFKGHSLSVSDVVVLHQNGQDTAHYVDSFGYKEVPEFFKEQENALIPADLETGETIKTPRGTFYVTAMSREQMEAAGYGLHHQSDDGKYLIMGNGTRAFAVPVQPENYLKAAEQTTEQNYNMIDGQINNTPTTAELEAKVKAGETISLVDLAEAVKADKERGKAAKTEKKPSIRAQLRADKEKTAQKKAAKSKNHELEV